MNVGNLDSALRSLSRTLSHMIPLLDSLSITVERLDFQKNKAGKNKRIFKGPIFYSTARKVNSLCNKDWPKVQEKFEELAAILPNESKRGRLRAFLRTWGANKKNLTVYLGLILRELSLSEESAIYRKLYGNGPLGAAKSAVSQLREEIPICRKVIDELHKETKDIKAGVRIAGLRIHEDLDIERVDTINHRMGFVLHLIFRKDQRWQFIVDRLIEDITRIYDYDNIKQKHIPSRSKHLVDGLPSEKYIVSRDGKILFQVYSPVQLYEPVGGSSEISIEFQHIMYDSRITHPLFLKLLALYKKS